jgi:hypothetical protein
MAVAVVPMIVLMALAGMSVASTHSRGSLHSRPVLICAAIPHNGC